MLSAEGRATGGIAESSGASILPFTETLQSALKISSPLAVSVAPYPYGIWYCPTSPFVPVGWYLVTV